MSLNDEIRYFVWLVSINGIGPKLQRSLLNSYSSPKEIYNADKESLLKVPGIGPELAIRIHESKSLDAANEIIKNCNAQQINILSINDDAYFDRLRICSDIPVVLYCKGKLQNPVKTAGIVGPRKCDRNARSLAIEKSSELARNKIAIISGMAIGVDAYAHTAALKNNAYTIAVLGCGVDICYPKEHIDLYNKIAEQGLLLSAYIPGTKARAHNFPERNKIIAALSDKLYVIAPNKNSGSLITASCAEKYKKKVYIMRPDG